MAKKSFMRLTPEKLKISSLSFQQVNTIPSMIRDTGKCIKETIKRAYSQKTS